MKETLQIWGRIFTSPSEGYRRITPQTKIGVPLLIVLLLSVASGALMIPVISSDAYLEASSRGSLEVIESRLGTLTEADREMMAAQTSSPLARNINIISALLGPPIMLMLTLLAGALVLWVASLIFKPAFAYWIAFRLLIFTSVVLILQGAVQAGILLLSDFTARFNSVTTMRGLSAAANTALNAAIFIPDGALPDWLLVAVGYVTDVFHIIFFVLLFFGVRAAQKDASAGRAAIPVAFLAAAGLLLCVGGSLVTSTLV